MDSFEKFSEYRFLDRCEFYTSLKDECISEKDYLHTAKVWNKFKMNTMSDYHDHYLKTNVLLLTDVFEKFVNTCLKYHRLDPCHYFNSPGISWDAMLKIIGTELKLISESNMHDFIEEKMRGGISYIAKRYSKANNKYMIDHESSEEVNSLFI